MTAQTATGHTAQDAETVPAKPAHTVAQLTTGELAREVSKLQAGLKRPFADSVKALLQARLDAVRAEQADRKRRREADTAAAKAELAAQGAADRPAGG